MTDTIRKTIEAMYAARVNNDVAACRACFSDDARLELAGGDPAVYQSEDAVPPTIDEQIEALVSAWRWILIDEQRLLIEGNQAATMYWLHTEFCPTGDIIRTQISDHMVMDKNGRISEFIEFVDTALVSSLAQKAAAS